MSSHGPVLLLQWQHLAAIARLLIGNLKLAPTQAATIRSLASHIVAGVATDEEVKAFRSFSDSYAG